jgi:hypothetical protein
MKYTKRTPTGFSLTQGFSSDQNDNPIKKNKRVGDIKMITALLKCGSPYKLTLKQYKFLMIRQARETMNQNQRMWIELMYEKLNTKTQ